MFTIFNHLVCFTYKAPNTTAVASRCSQTHKYTTDSSQQSCDARRAQMCWWCYIKMRLFCPLWKNEWKENFYLTDVKISKRIKEAEESLNKAEVRESKVQKTVFGGSSKASASLPRLFVGKKVLTAPKRLVWFANHWKKFIIFFERWIFLSSLKNFWKTFFQKHMKADVNVTFPELLLLLLGFRLTVSIGSQCLC